MNLDGLKKLLGQMIPGVAKGVGQAMKTPQALGTGGLNRLMQRPQEDDGMVYGPRGMEALSEMMPGEPWQNPMGPQPGQGYIPRYGAPFKQIPQEDDGMVYGPRGMEPLNQIRRREPWQNASGPFNR
jgi:hypothetical protein